MRTGVFHRLRAEGGFLGLVTALAFLLHGLVGPLPQAEAASLLCAQTQDGKTLPAHTCETMCLTVCSGPAVVPEASVEPPLFARTAGASRLPTSRVVAAPRWQARGDPIRAPPSTNV